jgi:TolB-like protein
MLLAFGEHVLDTDRHELRFGDELVAIEPQVFDLLTYLVQNRDRVVTKDELLEAVWKGRFVSESALTTRINAARRAVSDTGKTQRIIRTLARTGFRFVAEVREQLTPPRLALSLVAVELQKPSIAVLPFQNMSSDPAQEYFADGMVEEITTALSRIRWLYVVARNSSFTYKGRTIDVRQVGRELGVRYVLEGSIRKSGDRVRITAQLIEAETNAHLWSERFDGLLEQVFDLQDQVATSVAGAIEPALETAEGQRASRRRTNDLVAYDLYLRAHALMLSPARHVAELEELFDRLIDRVPDFGPALGLAAAFHMNSDIFGWSEDHDANCRKGLRRGRQALSVANDDPTVLVNAAFALGYFGENIRAMIALVDKALSLNPSSARAWHVSGCLRLWSSQPDLAIEHTEVSLRLSPRTRVGWGLYVIAAAHLICRRFEEALAKALVAVQEDPNPIGYQALIACYAHLGRIGDAREALRRLQSIAPMVGPQPSRLATLMPEFSELVSSGMRIVLAAP